jgi:hypothetical protein
MAWKKRFLVAVVTFSKILLKRLRQAMMEDVSGLPALCVLFIASQCWCTSFYNVREGNMNT